jgi:hypothetical protein
MFTPRALIRLSARDEWSNGFAVRCETWSALVPKPTVMLPKYLKASVFVAVLVSKAVIALKTSCHVLDS